MCIVNWTLGVKDAHACLYTMQWTGYAEHVHKYICLCNKHIAPVLYCATTILLSCTMSTTVSESRGQELYPRIPKFECFFLEDAQLSNASF